MAGRIAPDVAVVGASAAGLRAAWAASLAGARTVVLEAREEIGVPESPAIVAFDALWKASVRPRPGVVRRRFPGVRLASPGGEEMRIRAPGVVLDRARFDRDLAKEAEDAGVEFHLGVTDLDARPDKSLVAEGLDVAPRVIVFADGARSLARKFLNPVERPDEQRFGATLRREGSQEEWLRIGLGSHAPGGRTQVTPMGDGTVRHWTFWRGGPEDAEARARRALAVDVAALGWKDAPTRFEGAAADPVVLIPAHLSAPGIVVCGGAGGQGGLEAGLAAGETAGRAAALWTMGDANALRRYEREWKAEWLGGYLALRWAFRRLEGMEDRAVDRAFAAWDGRTIDVEDLGLGRGRWGRGVLRMALSHPRAWVGAVRAVTG